MSWTTDLINNLDNIYQNNGSITYTSLGGEVAVKVTQELVSLIKDNEVSLAAISLDTFKEFLGLLEKRQTFAALIVIYGALDNSVLISNFQSDSVKLAEIAKQTQQQRDFWIWFAEQVGTKIVIGALSALLA